MIMGAKATVIYWADRAQKRWQSRFPSTSFSFYFIFFIFLYIFILFYFHFIEMNKSCMDERNILSNKSKYRKKIILFHLLIFADSG